MHFCNVCAKNNEQVKNIRDNKISSENELITITELLNIFRNDIVEFILDDKNALICNNCLKQLNKCFEFVQQLKDSANKLKQGKEIKTEHDYSETSRNECGRNEVKSTHEITVICEKKSNVQVESDLIKSRLHFRPILPKPLGKEIVIKKESKPLSDTTRLYKCFQCAELFKSFRNLKQHEKDYCKRKLVKDVQPCKFCYKCFCKEDLLGVHITLKHPCGEFLCCLCEGKTFAAKGYLGRHVAKIHKRDSLPYSCGECQELVCFSSQEEVHQHFLLQHNLAATEIQPKDRIQPALNEEDMDLEMHEEFLDEFLLAHSNENSFQFSECWEALDLHLPDMLQGSSANLNNVQDFKEAFACPKCFEQFKNPQPLLKHLADMHNMPVLICNRCRESFASFKDFKTHKLQKCLKNYNKNPLTVVCPYCNKSFGNSANLKQHLRIVHTQLKRHICQLCDKQFSTLDHLKKHVLSQHQNERKHVCMVCDKNFTQLSHLKQHLAIHITGKTVNCSECSSKFWRKIDLERHRQKEH